MENKTKLKRELTGIVTKVSGINTLKVRVERRYPHPKYGKIVKDHRNFLVNYDPETSSVKLGDVVRITEAKPFSKLKAWELVNN